MPSLFSTLVTRHARRAGLDDERLDAGAAGGLVDRRPHDDEAVRLVERALAAGAEDLGAVQHPVVAVAHAPWLVIAAESEPQPGSVIAIAAHFGLPSWKRPRKRLRCSGVPAAATAAPPRPALGMLR